MERRCPNILPDSFWRRKLHSTIHRILLERWGRKIYWQCIQKSTPRRWCHPRNYSCRYSRTKWHCRMHESDIGYISNHYV
ncbi:hypothetical protein SERLA73DRAFT_185007 [Serpula lacrymans var. lacrymans S7.3]|uniref:Uncharacterized protein n=1 Tax=Serpula lacrymans var. lacrymans (strain S7.3) TaxID=936435 RepID=F8Q3W9_SERL3|nr:hypothetical protein SERLA73DRAFT_185007 [Serpula lacrymans var. lacrymans S7.3]